MVNITDHHDGHGLAEDITIIADDPDASGASHFYRAYLDGEQVVQVQFQQGPRGEYGSTPGAIDNVLLAIVKDRMRGFMRGPFRSRHNEWARYSITAAMDALNERADERAKRGVLGKAVA